LLYDDIRSRPDEVLQQLYAFVGVDPSFVPPSCSDRGSDVRRGTSPRGPRLERTQQAVYGFLSTRVYYPLKQLIGVRRAMVVNEVLGIRRILEFVFQRPGYPTMAPSTRVFLAERLGDETTRLEQLLDIELSHWRSRAYTSDPVNSSVQAGNLVVNP
jgi:hypothetical protein